MTKMQTFLVGLGRIFFSIIFILAGVNKILDWSSVEAKVLTTFCDWQAYVQGTPWAESLIQFIIPWSATLLGIATFLELVGGLLLFLGCKVRLGTVFLMLFLITSTALYHCFWFVDGKRREVELGAFLKNLALFGGLIFLMIIESIRKPTQRNTISSYTISE